MNCTIILPMKTIVLLLIVLGMDQFVVKAVHPNRISSTLSKVPSPTATKGSLLAFGNPGHSKHSFHNHPPFSKTTTRTTITTSSSLSQARVKSTALALAFPSNSNNNNNNEKDKWNRRKFIGTVVAGSVVTVIAGGEIYARCGNGNQFDTPLPTPEKGWDTIEQATIVFHGAGGPDSYTDELSSRYQNDEKHYYTLVNWYDYSQNTLQASFNGKVIGERIAMDICQLGKNLKSLHVIGISVGAFAADALVKKYKDPSPSKSVQAIAAKKSTELKNNNAFVQLTLLDPFCLRGTIGVFYGARQYGLKADYAQQFLNTDDPVPSTNSPLPKCAVTDVTKVRPSSIFGHDWPLVYYTRYCDVGIVPKDRQRSKGDILTIESLPEGSKVMQ